MKYSLEELKNDVMAWLGETVRAPAGSSASGIPWPEDVIGVKAASLLAEEGRKLIEGVAAEFLGAGVRYEAVVSAHLMPCGLYGAEVRLPDGFLRLVSVKMGEWRRSVGEAAGRDSPAWRRQWSVEAGVAGNAVCPRAYLDSDGSGRLLRLLGSEAPDDQLEWLCGWCVPEADGEGRFDFPEILYPDLVGRIAERPG